MTIFLYLKIALAMIMALLPFVIAAVIKDSTNEHGVIHTLKKFANEYSPTIARFFGKINNFFSKLHRGMRTRKSCRRFYVYIFTIVLIFVQAIDNIASMVATAYINSSFDIIVARSIYKQLVSSRTALAICMIFTLLMFFYRLANTLLTDIHTNEKLFFYIGGIAMFICISSAEYFILAEVLFLLLFFSYFYCEQESSSAPRKQQPIKTEFNRSQDSLLAA